MLERKTVNNTIIFIKLFPVLFLTLLPTQLESDSRSCPQEHTGTHRVALKSVPQDSHQKLSSANASLGDCVRYVCVCVRCQSMKYEIFV